MNLIKKTIHEALKTPGFSALYIIGVALTIAFTIIYGMLLYAQLGPVYPEYDRASTVYLETMVAKSPRTTSSGAIDEDFINDYLRNLKSVEKMTATIAYDMEYPMVQTKGHGPEFHAEMRYVEPSFFDFYRYEFLAGKPFSKEDFDSRIPVADITDGIARRLFGSAEEAVGKDISIDHIDYRIRGVFREGSALNVDSYGEIFVPYSMYLHDEWKGEGMRRFLGSLRPAFILKPGKDAQFRDELRDICRRINAMDTTEWTLYIPGVVTHAEHILTDTEVDVFDKHEDDDYQLKEASSIPQMWKPFIIALLVVLIIPALNVSGLIGSRMDRMASELGVRRSFGANRRRLMGMVLTENLILTLIGGILGLIAAWLISAFAGDFLLQFTPLAYENEFEFSGNTSFITGETAFAPIIFILTLALCVILNLISAWIPAHHALHSQITDSLNSKR